MSTHVMHRLSIRATETGQDAGYWWISNDTPPATIRGALQTLERMQRTEPAAGWQAFMDGRPADVETLAILAKMAQAEPVYRDGAEQQPTNPPAPGQQTVRGPLGVLEIRAALLADGFTHYETRAGLRPLEQFDPYGMAPPTDTTPAGLNWGPKWTPYEGAIVTEADGQTVIRDWPGKDFAPPLFLGGFPVSKQPNEQQDSSN